MNLSPCSPNRKKFFLVQSQKPHHFSTMGAFQSSPQFSSSQSSSLSCSQSSSPSSPVSSLSSSNTWENSDTTCHQTGRCVDFISFDLHDREKFFEIVALTHEESDITPKLYFILLGDHSFAFCLSLETVALEIVPSFELKLDYSDPRYSIAFVTTGLLAKFVEIFNSIGETDCRTQDPVFSAQELFRNEGWEMFEPTQVHIEKIQKFFEERGVQDSVIQ